MRMRAYRLRFIILWTCVMTTGCALSDYHEKKNQKETIIEMIHIAQALERVKDRCGAYPVPDSTQLGVKCSAPGNLISALSKGGYLAASPVCDAWDDPMEYPDPKVTGACFVALDRLNQSNLQECQSLFKTLWTNLYVIHSNGRDGQKDCGYGTWKAGTQGEFIAGAPTGNCRPSTGSCAHDDFDCDLTYVGGLSTSRKLLEVHFPEGIGIMPEVQSFPENPMIACN